MKTLFVTLSLLLSAAGFAQMEIEEDHFSLGEVLEYKIKYGWFKIGEARVGIDSTLYTIEGDQHYRLFFNLRTVGWIRIFADLDLSFESLINTKTLQPHHATRITINGKKSNSQFDEFHYSDSIYVKTYKKEKDEFIDSTFAREGKHFTDALGTYFYARSKELQQQELTRLYIASRIYQFGMKKGETNEEKNSSYYELLFPPIKQFPEDKTSYAILYQETNIPIEIKLSTNDGNFYLILEE